MVNTLAKFIDKFKKLAADFSKTLFPGLSCDNCGFEIQDPSFRLCPQCLNEIKFHNNHKTCPKCGNIISEDELICAECKDRAHEFNFDKAISVCDYSPVSGYLIKAFKFDGKIYTSETIAKLMIDFLRETNLNFDSLTFVPLSKERLAERGFNQAEILANAIAKAFDKEVLDLIYRSKNTPKQSTLSQKERLENLKDSIKIKTPTSLKGKTVVLIDDVFTTGTTLNECAGVLRKLRPAAIIAFTFAKVDFKVFKDSKDLV